MRPTSNYLRNQEGGLGKSTKITRDPRNGKTTRSQGEDFGRHTRRKVSARLRDLKNSLSEKLQTYFSANDYAVD